MKEKIYEIESEIDNWLINNLDESIPRNKYIYHCNLAFIDIIVSKKCYLHHLKNTTYFL